MICPHCGVSMQPAAGRCPACGAALAVAAIATDVVPIDTTGLPPGATFGASRPRETAAETLGATTVETMGAAVTAAVAGQIVHGAGAGGPLKVGQPFGPRYHIINLLGVGGMGAVYQAWDAELSVAVALKVIRIYQRRSASPEAEARLKQELLLARQVTHKHVVRIHDLGEIDGIKYITMPYINGDDLATELRREGKLPIATALRLARQIAAGLQAAHEAGVVHRDLKPANIMISDGVDDRQALIMDFGISASADRATTGTVLGTLEYMAPEQAVGGTVDARADVYAFGLILYEMLTGPRLVVSATPEGRLDAMKQRIADGMVPIRMLDRAISEPLEAVVMRCLENDPEARFQNAADICAALAALDDAGEVIPVPPRISRPLVAAAAGVVFMLTGVTYIVGKRMAVPPASRPIVSVLVGDFDNRSGDGALDGPIGAQALGFALEGAPYVALYPSKDARALAAQLSGEHSDRLTVEAGRLIARREGINVLVDGSIEKSASAYRLAARVIDPVTDRTIVAASATAADRAGVLRAIDALAGRVRVALGESKTEMDKVAAAETFTAGSLDAMQAYARAQDLVNGGKVQDALSAYQEAIRHDPQMGRAYSGMAIIYRNLGLMDNAEATFKEALKYVDRMSEREKYRTLGAYYFSISHNYPKAIETYESLIAKYPTDQASLANLAFAHAKQRNFVRAVEISRQIVALYSKNVLARTNYAAYALYAGNFDEAIQQTRIVFQQNPTYQFAFLPLALAQLSKGDVKAGLDAYARLEQLNAFGASLAKLGVADFAMYQGKYRDAAAMLSGAIAADEKAGTKSASAAKQVALAESNIAIGRRDAAIAAARKAAALGSDESVLFPAALALVAASRENEARAIGETLAARFEDEPRSYGRLIDAEIARARGRLPDAVDAVRDAQKRHDSWWSRFLLGRLYEQLDEPHHAEAIAELEAAIKRRGEAADAFIADTPTLRYVPEAYYWLGRAQEGVEAIPAARRNYDQFLALRAATDVNDPLVIDATRRAALLR